MIDKNKKEENTWKETKDDKKEDPSKPDRVDNTLPGEDLGKPSEPELKPEQPIQDPTLVQRLADGKTTLEEEVARQDSIKGQLHVEVDKLKDEAFMASGDAAFNQYAKIHEMIDSI
jgi:CRISPR/Cas system-associated protein Cas7 (RAMP superfamily)